MEQIETSKVYRFDFNLYKKHNLKKLILSNTIIAIIYTVFLILMYSSLGSSLTFYLGFIGYTAVLIIKLAKEFADYFHAKTKYKKDVIAVKEKDGHIVSFKLHLTDNKNNEYYSINSISELDRKPYIKIEGDFCAKSAHSLLKDKTTNITYLRIPPIL